MELMRAFDNEIHISIGKTERDIYSAIVTYECSRFWVSEERATIVVSEILRGGDLNRIIGTPTKRRMYIEIVKRVKSEIKKNPGVKLREIVYDVVDSPAPEFYITPGTAKVIISKIRSKWYERKRLKYRHLL